MTLNEIAQAIVASRREFGEIFLQAQVEFNLSDRDRFAAVALSGDDVTDFTEALSVASNKGWLPVLLRLLIDRGRHNGALIQALKELDPTNQLLQAITNPLSGFAQPGVDQRRIASVIQWTAKVIVLAPDKNELKTGTGVLIGAHLVLTAWHVVASLFEKDEQGEYKPIENVHDRLSVVFDYRLAGGDRNAPLAEEKVPAHPQWCVAFSACHADELASSLPRDLKQLEGKWDYVVIRLAGTPGRERLWAKVLAESEVPAANSNMFLFQHAAGHPLTYGFGFIEGTDRPDLTEIVPRLRFLHRINALGGSSGGPCFDKTFTLFGIHQGVWGAPANVNAAPAGAGAKEAPIFNRGVPIVRVKESILKQLPELPVPNPEDTLVWELRLDSDADAEPVAVIGCDELQTLTWRAAMNRTPRIILIAGEPASGKTFRLDLLESLLHAGHLKVSLNAVDELRKGALELARSICRLAGAELKAVQPPTELVSTSSDWLKSELVPAVIAALETVRDGRLVWLSFRNLNHVTVQGNETSDFLFALYESVATIDWLRIVLDGMKRDVPINVQQKRSTTQSTLPTVKDIERYLKRSIAAGGRPPPDDNIRVLAEILLEDDFAQYRRDDPATSLMRLSQKLAQLRKRLERL